MTKRSNLEGQRFGRLTAVEYVKGPKKGWRCFCDCGEIRIYETNNLTTGKSKSCGCLRKEITSERMTNRNPGNKMAPGEGSMTVLINQYVQGAKTRGLKYELTREEFGWLTSSNCHYCGIEPKQIIKGARSNGPYIYNGIDRMNSSEGYNYANCLPCCNFCNIAKMDKTLAEFFDWLQRISTYLRKTGDIV